MSLLSLVGADPLDYFRPSLLLDRHWGWEDEDFLDSYIPRRKRRMLLSSPYTRNWRSQASSNDKGSTLSIDKNKFQVNLDVQQFSPEEIKVKASGDTITVEGKHEEKQDEHGYISRHFVRKYTLPKGHDIDRVESKLSSDGVLTITAPKHDEEKGEEREIPIAITGRPSEAAIEAGEDKENRENKEEKREARKKK